MKQKKKKFNRVRCGFCFRLRPYKEVRKSLRWKWECINGAECIDAVIKHKRA